MIGARIPEDLFPTKKISRKAMWGCSNYTVGVGVSVVKRKRESGRGERIWVSESVGESDGEAEKSRESFFFPFSEILGIRVLFCMTGRWGHRGKGAVVCKYVGFGRAFWGCKVSINGCDRIKLNLPETNSSLPWSSGPEQTYA